MNMIFTKAWRDIRINPKRTFLVLFALILGIGGVGTVLVSFNILNRDLNRNFLQTNPPHLILYSNEFTQLDLSEFINLPEVQYAEFRDYAITRIEIRPDVWVPLMLYGVADFDKMQIAMIFAESPELPIEKGKILVERDGLRISYIEVDSTVSLRVDGTIKLVPVGGVVFDPAQAPATQESMIYAYTDSHTFQEITSRSSGQRLLVQLKDSHSQKEVKVLANKLTDYLKDQEITIDDKEIPLFQEHPHQWQLNTILFLVGTIGLLAFLMSAVLVSQLMGAILVSHTRQIGILKATGASRFQVLKIYLFMLVILGFIAGFIAIPLAILAGEAFAQFIAGILNFNIYSSTPIWLGLFLFMMSILLPILMSLSKLLNGTGISVREALNDYGISNHRNTNQLNWLKRLHIPQYLILAVRNSIRNRKRVFITVLTMSLGVAIFSTGFNVRQSLWNFLSGMEREMNFDIQVSLKSPADREEAFAPFMNMENLAKLDGWSGGNGRIETKISDTEDGMGIVALPYDTDYLHPEIMFGRWLSDNQAEIVLNQKAWSFYGNPVVGSELDVTIKDTTVKVRLVGIADQFALGKIYMDETFFIETTKTKRKVSTILFVAKDQEFGKVIQLKKEIENRVTQSNLQVALVMSHAEKLRVIYAHLNIILSTILILSFLVLLVSAVGMASAMGINIWERTREIGVMRAIGATPKRILAIFVSEGMLVSLLSMIIGIILSYPLSKAAALFFGTLMLGEGSVLRYAFSSTGLGITLMVTLTFGWIASRFPARNAINLSTREALAYE